MCAIDICKVFLKTQLVANAINSLNFKIAAVYI